MNEYNILAHFGDIRFVGEDWIREETGAVPVSRGHSLAQKSGGAANLLEYILGAIE